MRSVLELLEIAALSSGMDDFGMRLAEARRLPDLGPALLMLREEETVRDALQAMIAVLHLHSDALYMHLEEGDDPILYVDIIVGGVGHYRQAMDTTVAGTTKILRLLLGEDWTPESVCFTHSRPVSKARHDRFFRCPIDFSQEFNGIVLRRQDLEKRLPSSSPALRRQVERYIQSINFASDDNYVRRVTQLVAMALPKGEARAEIVARRLGVDCRTLNRRLARSGLNYSGVVEKVRRSLAAQHMLGSERPLSDIAGVLGFSSLSALTRWFRHSFDCAPSEWRKAQRDSATDKCPKLSNCRPKQSITIGW